MIASEANPLVKSGGLADVVYALSKELNKQGQETIILLPYYQKIKGMNLNVEYLGCFNVFMSWRQQYCGICKTLIDGITYYLIDNEQYFNRPSLYSYDDDGERFAFLALASIEVLKFINFKPDIIHVHDWQSAIVPCLIKEKYRYDEFFNNTHYVLTIHNPAFKGYLDKYFLNNFFGLSDELFDNGRVRFDNQVSTLKAGIVYSDKITTVSPTHRNELLDPLSEFKFSYVLELRYNDFVGIVNGIDTDEFNPATDTKIAKTYTPSAFLKGKEANKKALLDEFHLPRTDGPVYGLVSRLTWQKGIDLILANVEHLVHAGATLVVLGSGEGELENAFQRLRDTYPNNVGIYIGYNDALAHKVYAGSDFFLMPSLFEPCGIGQLIAMRYGTLPIVRETGGLCDTVYGYNNMNLKFANGFRFTDYKVEGLRGCINHSLQVYYEKDNFKALVKNALNNDVSWKKSTEQYIDLYRKAMGL